MPIHLYPYHVKKSWIKNLLIKVPGKQTAARKAMLQELDRKVLYANSKEESTAALQEFYKKYEGTQAAFVQYFKKQWEPILGACTYRLKSLISSSVERCMLKGTGRQLLLLIETATRP